MTADVVDAQPDRPSWAGGPDPVTPLEPESIAEILDDESPRLRVVQDDDDHHGDPDLDRTPRAEERTGGLIHAEMLGELELTGGRHYANATELERGRLATAAAVTARVALAQARRAGFDSIEDFLAATVDPPELAAMRRREDATPAELRPVSSIERPVDVDVALVEDLVRPGSIVVLAAPEGLGKTRMAQELAIRCAAGRGAVFGRYRVPRPIRVALIDEENGEAQLWREEEAVLAALDVSRAALDGLWRVSFAGLHLARPDRQAWLRAQLHRARPELVIIDTGGAVVDDEWGPSLKDGIRFLRELIRDFGCAFVILVHLTKPGRERSPGAGGERIHGSALSDVMGQWTRHADVVLVASDLGADRVRLAVRKRITPSTVILAKAGGLWNYVADADAPVSRERTEDRVLAAIAAGAATALEIAELLEMPKRTVFDKIRHLRNAGFVADGSPYELTDDGREAIG